MYKDIAAKSIPIKNIYYMLSYAWDTLKINEKVDISSSGFDNIYNLLAKIYLEGLKSIIKRGIYKDYISKQEELGTLRGRINIIESINNLSFLKNKMFCEYDDFSTDNTLNSIVKSTIELLMSNSKLDQEFKEKLKVDRLYFNNIESIDISLSIFSKIRYNKNNIHYKMLIDISKLIYEGLLVTEDGGNFKFLDFIRDRQLANLYEKFVLNFYKKRLGNRYIVHSPIINWDAYTDIIGDQKYLPIMKTDIVVEDKADNIQTIIDTKFYSNTLSNSQYQSTGKIHSNNLYQIYSYINNSKFNGDIRGMLLYPQINETINANYIVSGKKIMIKTVNLDDEWEVIEERLLSIIK